MALNRRDTLDAFSTLMSAVSGVGNVVRSLVPVDIKQYTIAQLPLINIIEPPEDVQDQMTSMRAMQNLALNVRTYFVYWGADPDSTYEALMKAIRDRIGAGFKVSNTATAAQVGLITELDGEMPLYFFDIEIVITYYLNQEAT